MASAEEAQLVELLPEEYSRPVSLIAFHVAVVPKSLGGELLKLLGSCSPLGAAHLHLKRVRAAPATAAAAPAALQVLLCPAEGAVPEEVTGFLSAKGCQDCCRAEVPRDGALTRSQLSEFSAHWPLTFRKPSFEPLELSAAKRAEYARLLARAEEVGQGRCACVMVDRCGREVAIGIEAVAAHPLRHAVMEAIQRVADAHMREGLAQLGAKRPRHEEEYLCQDYEVVTTHEPCVMCSMALVHSRVRLVAYRTPDHAFGGLGGKLSLHTCESLNHQFRVLRWR